MRQQQQLPRLQEDESFPGRLHTQSKKIKFGSTSPLYTATDNFSKKSQKQSPVAESQFLRHIDTKLEQYNKDIEQRNDMILTIEKGFESVRQELIKEKMQNEEKNKQLLDLNQQYTAAQTKYKTLQEVIKNQGVQSNEKDKEKIQQLEAMQKSALSKEHQLHQNVEQLNAQLNDLAIKVKSKDETPEDAKKLKELIRKTEEKKNKSQMLIDELKKSLESIYAEKQLVKGQLENYKKEFHSKEEVLNSELSNTQNKAKELQKDKTQLSEQLKKLPNPQDNVKLQENINLLKQQVAEQNRVKDKEIQQSKSNLDAQMKNIDYLNQQIEENKLKIEACTKQIAEKSTQIESAQKSNGQTEATIKEQQMEIKQLNNQIEECSKKLSEQKPKNMNAVVDTIAILEKTDREIQKGLACTFCNKFIKQPVTIIPCGHSYCFECKKGYQKECFKCGPKLKIEAMYRNELLDDIIEMVKLVEQSIVNMKQITQQ